jgi:outer membrane protein insertion porin family
MFPMTNYILKNTNFFRGFVLSVMLMASFVLSIPAAYAQKVASISVVGAERIEEMTVLTYMDVERGSVMSEDGMDQALKNLFATGLFADVSMRMTGSTLVVKVVENPIISRIAFEGNDDLKEEDLLSEIQLKPRHVFSRTRVQADVKRLYQLYRRNGRFTANIDPKVVRLDQNRVDLVFEIDEGPVTKVSSIRFIGNKKYEDDQLRSVISTKESTWYRFLTSADRYDPDRIAYDEELIRRFYLSEGYVDFRIVDSSIELMQEKQKFFVTMTVNEGNRYKIGNVEIDTIMENLDVDALLESVTIESGEWYNADTVQKHVDILTDRLGDMQYAFVSVQPDIRRDPTNKIVDIVFSVKETPLVFVERVDIHGNVRTLDKVIRREIELLEGDPFNRSKVAKAERNIRDLGYFEKVELDIKPGSAPDKSVIDVRVTEKSTGELSVGAGFSSSEGPLADFRIRERNLLGKGQDLTLAAVIAGEKTEFDASFTEPFFMNRDMSFGIDAFHITRDLQDESSYDQLRTGGALRFGYPLSDKWRQSLRYRLEKNEIRDVKDTASFYIREQAGNRVTSAFSQRLGYDNRNSTMFTTRGWHAWLDTEIAGAGGDAKYVSGKIGGSWYYPVADKIVLNVIGETGVIEGYGDTDVQINERYFLGGETLRGFERSGLGPRDVSTDDALGGNYFYRSSAELSFPIGLPEELGIKGHAFNDIGSLWDIDSSSSANVADQNSLRASAGVGVSWRSPFGPIRVDLAKPYLKEDYDVEEVFRFNFGTRF